jgi:hypothetical protein
METNLLEGIDDADEELIDLFCPSLGPLEFLIDNCLFSFVVFHLTKDGILLECLHAGKRLAMYSQARMQM